ncbi:MAG: hypothetical protein U5L96_17660 [Owenweeksia sp.]|nr:hypothetical protein [Owenweeksia sp.]
MKRHQDTPLSYHRHPFVYLVEAADDICYSIIDYEDAHRLGILSFEKVRHDFMALLRHNPREDEARIERNLAGLARDPNESVAYLRAKVINFLVNRCAAVFLENKELIMAGKFKGFAHRSAGRYPGGIV